MAIAENLRCPVLTALKMAVRSAQTLGPKAAFSMLQPEKTSPASVRSAAPTKNLE